MLKPLKLIVDNKMFTCVEANVIGTGSQVSERLRINPLSPEVIKRLEKIVVSESDVVQFEA